MTVEVNRGRADQGITVDSIVSRLLSGRLNVPVDGLLIKTALENFGVHYKVIPSKVLWDDVQDQVEHNKPLIIGYDWQEGGGHAMVIGGWEFDLGIRWVFLHDPLADAEKRISFDRVIAGNYDTGGHRGEGHTWSDTILYPFGG